MVLYRHEATELLKNRITVKRYRKDNIMNNTRIISRLNSADSLDFYAVKDEQCYYIFTRKFRPQLYDHFKNGVAIHNLFDFSRANGNVIIYNTLEQLRVHLRYIEKEYGIKLLKEKKNTRRYKERYFTDIRRYEEELTA